MRVGEKESLIHSELIVKVSRGLGRPLNKILKIIPEILYDM